MPKVDYFTEDAPGKFLLQGKIDFAAVKEVLNQFSRVLFQQTRQSVFEVDIQGVQQAQTVVLSLLLEMQRLATKKNIQLQFAGIPKNLQGIAVLNGVDDFVWGAVK